MTPSERLVIRVVWDFFGPASQGTAAHFVRHLIQFLEEHECGPFTTDVEHVSRVHAVAYGDIPPQHLDLVGQTLKPHRVYEVTLTE